MMIYLPSHAALCAVGILLQSAGMCICASVVEQSTHEDTWVKCKDAEDAEMTCFWLQKRGVINDQKFDSFAIFATGPADFVMTSHRQKPKDPALSYPTPVTCVVTVAGTIISIAGFVLNFIGLRGLHW
jgi:hypothetical protein